MTKIGKTMITVKGEIHPVEIHYNRERKFFYRGVPDEVIALSSFRNRDYASEKELTQALSIALDFKCRRGAENITLAGEKGLIALAIFHMDNIYIAILQADFFHPFQRINMGARTSRA